MICLMRNGIQTPTIEKKYNDDVLSSNQEKDLSSNDESIGDLWDED